MTDYQTFPGRTSACCQEIQWALALGYIRKGFLWRKVKPLKWIGWSLAVVGQGFYDNSPIRFCPFCGQDLDAPEG